MEPGVVYAGTATQPTHRVGYVTAASYQPQNLLRTRFFATQGIDFPNRD